MTDISVVILVGNESLHIRRCLEKLAPLEPKQVFIVESQNGDNTHEIAIETAKSFGWSVRDYKQDGTNPQLATHHSSLITCFHSWPGLHAKQFNWAIDNLPISSSWILRLDADEYLTPETIEKLKLCLLDDATTQKADCADGCIQPGAGTSLFAKFCVSPSGDLRSKNITGLNVELKRRFCGGEIRHATVGIRQARIFRFGKGRCEERAMDEHIEVGEWEKVKGEGEGEQWKLVSSGAVIDFDGAFYDDNLNDMDWWREKHRGYAKREAKDALAFARGEVRFKRSKELYYRQPRYLRAFLYFAIRYFLKGGFLDGYAGWMWNFWQGLWYRCLVDHEIGKLKKG